MGRRRKKKASEIVWLVEGTDHKGRKFRGKTTREKALNLINGGAAERVSNNKIRKLYCYEILRLEILKRDNYICHYCGNEGNTVDHIIPRCKGGISSPGNLVCACNKCNSSKGHQSYEIFIKKTRLVTV